MEPCSRGGLVVQCTLQLSNPVVRDAFVVTLKTSLIAQALIVVFGTPTAYLLASRRFPGH